MCLLVFSFIFTEKSDYQYMEYKKMDDSLYKDMYNMPVYSILPDEQEIALEAEASYRLAFYKFFRTT